MTSNRPHRAPRRLHVSGRFAAASAAVLGSAALAVAGGAGPAGAAPSSAELSQSVVIADNHFTPDDVGVHVGDKVTWTNTDEVAHAVNSISGPEAFGTGREVLHNGDTFTWRFVRPGVYHYVDNLNHGMRHRPGRQAPADQRAAVRRLVRRQRVRSGPPAEPRPALKVQRPATNQDVG